LKPESWSVPLETCGGGGGGGGGGGDDDDDVISLYSPCAFS
jgi:hypothetical protein